MADETDLSDAPAPPPRRRPRGTAGRPRPDRAASSTTETPSARERASSEHGSSERASSGRAAGPGTVRRPHPPPHAPSRPVAPRRQPSMMDAFSDIPNFLRLLYGLLADHRVDNTDKLLVGAAVGYVLLPEDIIPDWIPIIGEIDDAFLLGLAIDRLIENAPAEALREHWKGDPRDLRVLDVQGLLGAASLFLPRRMRRRLRALGRV